MFIISLFALSILFFILALYLKLKVKKTTIINGFKINGVVVSCKYEIIKKEGIK